MSCHAAGERMQEAEQPVFRMNKHLEIAVQTLSDSWFPVNSDTLQRIKAGFAAGEFKDDLSALVNLLHTDCSLYVYALQKLTQMIKPCPADPFELFRAAGTDALQMILSIDEDAISPHDLGSASYVQALRLQQTMVSATASEALAEPADISKNLGFTCAVLRQLGITLIAWNYPHVYTKALTALKPGKKLDAILGGTLGFTPWLLGVAMARKMGISPLLRAGMGDTQALEEISDPVERGQVAHTADTLVKICEVGEALARASDPKHYPTAATDWEAAQTAIVSMLGNNGMRTIQERLVANCRGYTESAPDLFKLPASIVPATLSVVPETPPAPKKENPFARQCPPAVRTALEQLYKKLEGGHVSREVLQQLVRELIPAAGFQRGCVYLAEPDSMRLTPRLAIGTDDIRRYNEVDYASASSGFDPVASAFRCRTPIHEQSGSVGEGDSPYVAGQLGNSQKIGVLYLEPADALLKSLKSDPIVLFKALRQTLQDCLNLQ